MEIKEGYKQTEVGIIPKDWIVKSISEFSKPVRGGSPRPAGDPKYFNGNFIPWLTVASLTNIPSSKIYVTETETCLTEEGLLHSRLLEKETLIIANSGATLGVAKMLAIKCCANDGIAALIDFNNEISKIYLVYFINTQIKYLREVVATGNGQPNLNTELIGNIKVPFPPTKNEQQAIAIILTDTNNLIQILEKQIAKKRLIKQGVMQKLLTPKKGWKIKKLGEFAKTYGGLSGKTKTDFQNGKYPYIPFMNILSNPIIDTTYFDYVNIRNSESQNKAIKGDLFFNGSSETPEEVGMCSVLLDEIENLYLNSFCFGLRLFKQNEIHPLYLSYYFRSGEGRKLVFSLAQGATRYNLSKTNFLKLELPLPDFEEQIYITNVFRDIDSEIDSLQIVLSKYNSIKKGLMQNLLTGRIRLIQS
jgi:type I restriction enzyme, S subunit